MNGNRVNMTLLPFLLAGACLCNQVSHGSAQSPKAERYGSGGGDVAFNFNYGNLNGVDNKQHAGFGASVARNSGHISIAGEYSYLPQGSLTNSGVTAKEKIQQFGAALRVSLIAPRRFTPYVLVAGGYGRITATASAQGVSLSASQAGGYVGFGGGANLLLSAHFGIRPEFRWERQQFASTSVGGIAVPGGGLNDMRGGVGLFYVWGGTSRRKQ
jgi:hypothetical protein